VPNLATGERAAKTLEAWGRAVLVDDMATAAEVANGIAAEHVSLQCDGAEQLLASIRNAGAVFIGKWSPIAAGDYASGTNHVLPTGAAARAYSGVGVESFGRWMEVQRVQPSAAARLTRIVNAIAGAEGLPAHAASVAIRAARAGDAGTRTDDPIALLRRPGHVEPYAAEPSDEEIASGAGLSPDDVVRHDMNTLGDGPTEAAAAALAGYEARRLSEYGDLAYRRLREALSERLDVAPGRIIPGAGADELIRLITTATVAEGDAVVIPTPTFSMFAVEAGLAGARVVEVPRRSLGERQPVAQLRAAVTDAAARLVWLCSPNNPTGDRYSLDEIAELAADLPALVVVDEAYLEFAETSCGEAPNASSAIRLQEALPNVLVLRTFSKAYGLAGARLGYMVVPAPLAERFDALRLPLSVAGPTEALGLAALADEEAAADRRAAIVAERVRLGEALERLGCELLPSVTNFVTFRPPDAEALASRLLKRGIVLRTYPGGPMRGWLRASVLEAGANRRLIEAVQEALA
jgi:histidinol-phosphate aminotransferase